MVVATPQRRKDVERGYEPQCARVTQRIPPDERLHGASLTGFSPLEWSLSGSCPTVCLPARGGLVPGIARVRTRTLGGLGAGGISPPRLPDSDFFKNLCIRLRSLFLHSPLHLHHILTHMHHI